ncbi:MAG: Rpn family recombination-promoting nuclease/putative transposase [Treponema sp.]
MQKNGYYTDLPDSFILFFCPFDYPNSGLPVYTFKTICSEDKRIILPDGVTKVIINSAAADKETDPELKAFLEYMNGVMSDRPFIRKIDRYIKELKENEERRKEYMMLNLVEMDARKVGIQQGLQQGKSLGLAEGSRQKALETARNLRGMGLSIENISKATGLTVQEVEQL